MIVIKDEMLNEKITRCDILPLSFLKMSPYTGSKGNMRYRIEKKEPENEEKAFKLLVTTWPEPFAFDKTDDSLKKTITFDFSDEGLNEAVIYLENERVQNY